LADRFKEQRLDVLNKKSDLPVAQHFNGPGHSLEDVRVAVLKSGLAKKDVRQRGEMRQALAPSEIKRNFLFLVSLKTHTRAHFVRSRGFKTAHNCEKLSHCFKWQLKHPEEGSNAETAVNLYRR